jgi:PiT family inorganic phosphate transporter
MTIILLGAVTLFLAYSNGANDNFKGVATLYGSNTCSYKNALGLATIATLAGSIASVFLATALVKIFSGAGVVPQNIAASPAFIIAISAGAAGTVILATMLGFPVSTTHGLTGAIVGAGFLAVGNQLNLTVLASSFIAPLVLSPVIAVSLSAPFYKLLTWISTSTGVTRETCFCVGSAQAAMQASSGRFGVHGYSIAVAPEIDYPILKASTTDCLPMRGGQIVFAPVQQMLDAAHYVSAGAVCFARALNDTPKIVGPLLFVNAFDIRFGTIAVALAMALGGVLNSRKVADTMSRKICDMDGGQALAANAVTAFLVIFASRFGLPVSTTHVSVGSIAGIGFVNGTAQKSVLYSIVASWILTLPVAAVIAATVFGLARLFW